MVWASIIASKAIQSEQAATRERERIAREVHDVIARSLSITLLHLTVARRVLEQDRDVDDVRRRPPVRIAARGCGGFILEDSPAV